MTVPVKEHIKEHMMRMAVEELELLLHIIGDLGYLGYRISMCKIYGGSYKQCAIKYGIDKETSRRIWQKCVQKQHDIALKRIFNIK